MRCYRPGDRERKGGILGAGHDGPTHGSMEPAGVYRDSLGCHVHDHVFLFQFEQLKLQAMMRAFNGRPPPSPPPGEAFVSPFEAKEPRAQSFSLAPL